VYYVSASLSLANKLRRRDSVAFGRYGNSLISSFLGAKKRFTNPSSSKWGLAHIKKISETRAKKYLNIEIFLFAGCQVQISKPVLSLFLILLFVFLLYIYNTRQKRETKKKRRDARAVHNRHGRRGRDDVRAKHPPGVPERFKGTSDDDD